VLTVDSLDKGYAALNSFQGANVDLVWFGCPHASLAEIATIAALVQNRTLKVPLWITTARQVRDQAAQHGYLQTLEQAGGRIVSDTCLVVAPVEELGYKCIATNSGKGAFYGPGHAHAQIFFGSAAECVRFALA
jgi:hypothetical protein